MNEQWSNRLRRFLPLVFILVAAVCIGVIVQTYVADAANKAQQEELKKLYEESSSQLPLGASIEEGEYINSRFSELMEINPDLIGWLEAGSLSVPVVQGEDNDYYLKHDFYGNDDPHGTVFLDSRNQLEPNDDNLVLYGHNYNRTKNMFYVVEQYKDPAFVNENPTITFSTLHDETEYVVFAVFLTNTVESQGDVFDYHNQLRFKTTAEMNNFLEEVKARSLISNPVEVNASDKLITLSTCGYDFEGERIVLMARELRDDEKAEDFQGLTVKADNPIMPEIWTRLYGNV